MDSIKITSTVSTPKINDIPSKQTPSDSIFDINNLDNAVKIAPVSEQYQKESFRETLFQNLQKEILKPLMNSTTAEADALRKLVLISELFESSAGAIPKDGPSAGITMICSMASSFLNKCIKKGVATRLFCV